MDKYLFVSPRALSILFWFLIRHQGILKAYREFILLRSSSLRRGIIDIIIIIIGDVEGICEGSSRIRYLAYLGIFRNLFPSGKSL